MALKVIGTGFGRTSTLSTYEALKQLGYPCYHMIEVLRNPANKSHLDFWARVAEQPAGAQANWEEVFAGYTAAVDNPALTHLAASVRRKLTDALDTLTTSD